MDIASSPQELLYHLYIKNVTTKVVIHFLICFNRNRELLLYWVYAYEKKNALPKKKTKTIMQDKAKKQCVRQGERKKEEKAEREKRLWQKVLSPVTEFIKNKKERKEKATGCWSLFTGLSDKLNQSSLEEKGIFLASHTLAHSTVRVSVISVCVADYWQPLWHSVEPLLFNHNLGFSLILVIYTHTCLFLSRWLLYGSLSFFFSIYFFVLKR